MKLWKMRVRKVYESLAELEAYDCLYSIAYRLGYKDCETLWSDNPMIQGSVDPKDFGKAAK